MLIPAGEFMMGSAESVEELARAFPKEMSGDQATGDPPEHPQHKVRLTKSFYLGVHEVTQQQYERLMGENPSFHVPEPMRPVDSVSWRRCGQVLR